MSIYKERKRQLYAEAAEAIKNVPGIESVRVLKRNELLAALDMDKSTLDRMEARGEGPPKTQLSPKRIGYRIADVARWLDGRRKSSAEVQSDGNVLRRQRNEASTSAEMSVDGFCDRYDVGRTTAYEEIKAGRLRARKCRKRTIIGDDDAEDWLRRLAEIEPGDAS